MKYAYAELAGMIDHSLLHPTLTDRQILDGCRLAHEYRVASVCVQPHAVAAAARALEGSTVRVGTVVGFPHGTHTSAVKRQETALACRQGALEIDMVINIGKALSGAWDYVELDIAAVVQEAHSHSAIVKVIFENDYLPGDELKIRLCQICAETGADFVKTSTGYGFVKGEDGRYGYRGATIHDLKLMRAHSPERVQIKAAGGVRSLDMLIRVREAGCTRCGTSATREILEEYRRLSVPKGEIQ